MAKAAVDLVSYLPAPAAKVNAGCADLLGDQLFAYGSGPSIVVTEVPQLQVLLVLHGEHREAAVTAVKWAPDCHSRDLKNHSHVRLASGDSEGRVVVWDVGHAHPLCRVSDRFSDGGAAAGGSVASGALLGHVVGLEWVGSQPCLLAVLLSQGSLVIWDTKGGSLVWRKEVLSLGDVACSMTRDPLDCSRLAVCGGSGALVLVSLPTQSDDNQQSPSLGVKQYKITMAQGGSTDAKDKDKTTAGTSSTGATSSSTSSPSLATFQAVFPAARDLIFLTLAREVTVFDLELGVPAATITLPSSRPAFLRMLGVYGHGTTHGLGDEGGADVMVACHVEGSLSVWTRCAGELRYTNSGWFRLTPVPTKGATNSVQLLTARAKVWSHQYWGQRGLQGCPGPVCADDARKRLNAYLIPDRGAPDASGNRDLFGGMLGGRSMLRRPGTMPLDVNTLDPVGSTAVPTAHTPAPLLIVSVSSDGRLWQWQAALPQTPHRKYNPASPTLQTLQGVSKVSPPLAPQATAPVLTAMRQLLPQPVTCAAMFPLPVLTATHGASNRTQATPAATGTATGQVVMLGAALSVGGQLQVFTLQRGQVTPLSSNVILTLGIHREGAVTRGLRWLGATPRVITFTSERVQSSVGGASSAGGGGGAVTGWRNTVAVTDLRTRRTVYLRDVPQEPHRMLTVRASPSGFHVLLRLQDAPTELWAVGVEPPIKLMSLDVDWSSPEWLLSTDPTLRTAAPLRLDDLFQWPSAATRNTETTPSTTMPAAVTAAATRTPPAAASGMSFIGSGPSLVAAPTPSVTQAAGTDMADKAASTTGTSDAGGTASAAPTTTAPSPAPATDASVPVPYKQPTSAWQVAVNAATAAAPEEYVVYTYDEGFKCGVLRIRGRSVVNDERVIRPRVNSDEARFHATAMCGWGSQVLMGDYEGRLALWNTGTGAFTVTSTGFGAIRRLYVASAPHPDLYTAPDGVTITARAACIFGDGTLGVYDLTSKGVLRAGHAAPQLVARAVGRTADVAWLSLPCEADSGSLLLTVTDTGSLAFWDISQAADKRPSLFARTTALRTLLDTPSRVDSTPKLNAQTAPPAPSTPPAASKAQSLDLLGEELPVLPAPTTTTEPERPATLSHVLLAPPPPQGCSLLLPQPWLLLLRLLLQLGLQPQSLRALAGISDRQQPSSSDLSEAVDELYSLLPMATHQGLNKALGRHAPGAAGPDTGSCSQLFSPFHSQQQPPSSQRSASEIEPLPPSDSQATGLDAADTPTSTVDTAPAATTGISMMRAMMGQAVNMVKSTTLDFISGTGLQDGSAAVGGAGSSKTKGPGKGNHQPNHPTGFQHDLVGLVTHLARLRAGGQLLHPGEWEAYSSQSIHRGTHQPTRIGATPGPQGSGGGGDGSAGGAAGAGGVVARVRSLCVCLEVAARVTGDEDEACFWRHLPQTLQGVRDLQDHLLPQQTPALYPQQYGVPGTTPGRALAVQTQEAAAPLRVPPHQQQQQQPQGQSTPHTPDARTSQQPSSGSQVQLPPLKGARREGTRLWDEDVALAEAQERALWHESLSRSVFQNSQDLQERRMLEYVVLGDFQTAVAFLLASSPEVSVRYYRDALVTAALAAAANARPGTGARHHGSALQLQAAKVLSAHASSINDPLLGVPLHCAAGLYSEAVTLLQECGLWRYAANLTAHALTAVERGAALKRWAEHVASKEGSLWRAVGILVAAGCCREALHMLQESGRPDSAASFLAVCHAAGLTQTTTTPALALPQHLATPPAAHTGGGEEASALSGGLGTRTSLKSRSSQEGGQNLGHRLSMSKAEILQQTAAAAVVAASPKHSNATPDSTHHNGGTPQAGSAGRLVSLDVDNMLSRAFSSPAQATQTRVFSVLSLPGQDGGMGGDAQQDDVAVVTAQFVSYVCDLLKHL